MPLESENTHPPAATWLSGIEILRGIAAVSVVFHHCWSVGTQPRFPGYWVIEGFGTWGVSLFFLLSGYLLADSLWRDQSPGRLKRFYLRRAFRILPAYYLTIAILFLFFADHDLLFSRTGAEQLLANMSLTHYLRPETSSSLNVNGALWTLTIEAILYLLMPLLAGFTRLTAGWGALTLAAVGLGYRLFVARVGSGLESLYFDPGFPTPIARLFIARQFMGILPLFALGIGLKWLKFRGRLDSIRLPRISRSTTLRIVLFLLPSIAWLAFTERASMYTHWVWFTGHEAVLGILMVPAILAASDPSSAHSLLDRGAAWLGERSYGLYLWHFPVILSIYGRGPFLKDPDTSYWAARIVAILALSIAAAHLSWTAIEKPMQQRAKRLTAR